jgi:hypothetical protein
MQTVDIFVLDPGFPLDSLQFLVLVIFGVGLLWMARFIWVRGQRRRSLELR